MCPQRLTSVFNLFGRRFADFVSQWKVARRTGDFGLSNQSIALNQARTEVSCCGIKKARFAAYQTEAHGTLVAHRVDSKQVGGASEGLI
jgi:hypothetical protein